jgi:ribonuclease M5
MNNLYVVEGIHDEDKLHKINSQIKTFSIGGFGLNDEDIEYLNEATKFFNIVLLLDPDSAGSKLRTILSSKVKNCQHIYVDKSVSISKNKKKIGIEHVDINILKEYLSYEISDNSNTISITFNDIYDLGLSGQPSSALYRDIISKQLHLGKTNTKQFVNRLNNLSISKEDLTNILSKIKNG